MANFVRLPHYSEETGELEHYVWINLDNVIGMGKADARSESNQYPLIIKFVNEIELEMILNLKATCAADLDHLIRQIVAGKLFDERIQQPI